MTAAELRRTARSEPAPFPGRTRIAPGALTTVARAVVATALGVPAAEVSVRLSDRDGGLAVDARTPVVFGTARRDQLVWVDEQRAAIADGVSVQTGAEVSAVTLVVTGVVPESTRRVR
ncbi:hypothetical protein [Mycetocola reblochoni]|uniref:Uncharacterized protein n=2 Tax=Mycetocola reblochoni TaxID=331618 RepID=A0A1R4JGZ4_9MICO|nr:hypothetical protein [Mycetocola reblochoni]RLP68246.1 hypothetical protein D9V30_11105 [Mycetocola reblochoni]SJN31204.1 hypothetical protein FM119_07455 [Mycetocola reblochoni REB411]